MQRTYFACIGVMERITYHRASEMQGKVEPATSPRAICCDNYVVELNFCLVMDGSTRTHYSVYKVISCDTTHGVEQLTGVQPHHHVQVV